MKVCGVCETIFREYAIFIEGHCPLRNCAGQVIDIDDDIYESYKILNAKGYWTIYCCSGHAYETELDDFELNDVKSYVSFGDDFDFDYLPEGFIVEKGSWVDAGGNESQSTTISKKYDRNLSTVDLQLEIWKSMGGLLIWADKLEPFDYNE